MTLPDEPLRQARPGRTHVSHRDHGDRDLDPHDHAHHHAGPAVDTPPLAHDADALISARSLWLTRSGRSILQGVDIDIAPREIVTLIGPNGAGKTTLVRVLLGLEKPDRGSTVRKRGLVVGYVPQRFDVDRAIPLTVARFVELGRRAEDDEIARVLRRRRRRQARRSPVLGAVGRRAAAGGAGARARQVARRCWCSTSSCAASTMPARPSSTR